MPHPPALQTEHLRRRAPVFWPDIDVYFKRDLALAFSMVDAMVDMGVQVIKTAALHSPLCCLQDGGDVQYHVPGRGMVSEPYRAVIDRHVLPMPQLRQLCAHVRKRGLNLVVSVYDDEGVEVATAFDAVAIKIPSSNIVHAPLIRHAARSAKRLVLDTGRSTLAEIDRAVQWARAAGAQDLLVQHSPPGPPASVHAAHLSVMPVLAQRYGAACGLSDHCGGLDMLAPAVALGAEVIEKGVCPDAASADIDLAHALPLHRVPEALTIISQVDKALGTPDLDHRDGQLRPRDRMGLVAAQAMHAGERVTIDKIRFAFPTVGLPVEAWDDVQGRVLHHAVAQGEPLHAHHLNA